MRRSRFLLFILLVVVGLVLVAGSYEMGLRMRPLKHDITGVAYTKAVLAFAHYQRYGDIADYLEKKCYEDALSVAKFMRDTQIVIVADNLRRTGNDPTLLEYIKFRDPELLKSVLAGNAPEPQPVWTTCR